MTKPGADGRSADTELAELLPARAFVVEFRAIGSAGLGEPCLRGRVEHVVSGKAARFESAGELLDFMCDVLRTCAAATATDPQARR